MESVEWHIVTCHLHQLVLMGALSCILLCAGWFTGAAFQEKCKGDCLHCQGSKSVWCQRDLVCYIWCSLLCSLPLPPSLSAGCSLRPLKGRESQRRCWTMGTMCAVHQIKFDISLIGGGVATACVAGATGWGVWPPRTGTVAAQTTDHPP